MKFQKYHGEVGSWPALIVLPVLGEGVGVWVPFQLDTESVLFFFPRAISPAWPEVGPGAKTQQGK